MNAPPGKADSPKPDPIFPFSVPTYRFDQKNEMFKRCLWDEKMRPYAKRFYEDIRYRDRIGFRKLDYAFRNAAWNLEWAFGFGNSRSNSGLYSWEDICAKARRYIDVDDRVRQSPGEMSGVVKKAARFLGADLVGIAPVHPNWIYSHEFNGITKEHYPLELPEGCDRAVVMAIEMDFDAMGASPDAVAGAATGLGYTRMALVAHLVAAFIRNLGYRAIPSGNDTGLSIPLAMAAGLGEWSRMGLLVTERFGPRVRLCKVFTDLPLECDSYRPFGVVEFCATRENCAMNCPSKAIPEGGMTTEGPNISNHSGVEKWYVNAERCFAYWAKNRMDCTDCIRVCPFNKPPGVLHALARAVIRRTARLNRIMVRLDGLLRYDRRRPAQVFWSSK